MWQEVLAVDSRLCSVRTMDKELRPIYLKRRMQLMQAVEEEFQANQQQSGGAAEGGGGPIRNRRYISLRVKLLKRQFGLPSDVLSLKSLSINKDANDNNGAGAAAAAAATAAGSKLPQIAEAASATASSPLPLPPSSSSSSRFAFAGVKHIYDQHSEAVTRIKFARSDDSTLVAASMDGRISVCAIDAGDFVSLCGHADGVLDVDVSESNQFLVSCSLDGVLALWDLKTRSQLRATRQPDGCHVRFCRFLPRNNNLVVCGLASGTVKLMNVSTGKFVTDVGSPVLGKSLCAEINQLGSLLWVGGDRGYVESFRLVVDGNCKVAKGCRVLVDQVPQTVQPQHSQQQPRPVVSLSSQMSSRLTRGGACLVVTLAGCPDLRLFRVADEFGSIEPVARFSGGPGGPGRSLRCSAFAPIISYREGSCAAAGSDDGGLAFFDLSRPQSGAVVNTLLGHSKPVIALAFSDSEQFLASADAAGQIIVWKK